MKFHTSILFLVLICSISLKIEAQDSDISDNDYLSLAKFQLISGNIGMSEYYLNQIIEVRPGPLTPIKKRYQAIIEFIRGEHKKSNVILNEILIDKEQSTGAHYQQVCLLKILNALAINDLDTLKFNRIPCQSQTSKFSKNDQYWLDTMIKLKLHNTVGLNTNILKDKSEILSEEEETKLWLKTGLYLNREQDIIKLLTLLDAGTYQSNRVAEIIGFLYLRNGETEKALEFIDGINSANAENIRANISLQKKEYEVAFGHLKLAMQKKQDSINSLERSIPLTWILNQYEEGLVMLDNPTLKKMDSKNIRSIKIAYLTKIKKYDLAEKEMMILMTEHNNTPPSDVYAMAGYLSIMNGAIERKYDRRLSEEYTEKACRAFDGLSCWTAMKLTQWDNIGKTVRRTDETFSDKTMTLDSLKSTVVITPLKEEIQIDQGFIEELDSKTIAIK
jgi:hypothetical protein